MKNSFRTGLLIACLALFLIQCVAAYHPGIVDYNVTPLNTDPSGTLTLTTSATVSNITDLSQKIPDAEHDLQQFKSDIDEKSAWGVDTSAAEAQYNLAQSQISYALSLAVYNYTDELNDLSAASSTISYGETVLDKEWAESELATAQEPVNNVDALIAVFEGNSSTANDARVSTIITERDSAVRYISAADSEISFGNYSQARVDAEEGYQIGNQSYIDALTFETPLCGSCGNTSFIVNSFIAMMYLSGIIMAAFGLYARRFTGRVPAARPFCLLMFCAAAWSILYASCLQASIYPARVTFSYLCLLLLPFIPLLELWLVLAYMNKTEWITKNRAALLLIVPVSAAAIVIACLILHRYLSYLFNFSMSATGPMVVLQYIGNTFYEYSLVYSCAILALAVILLVTASRKQGTLHKMPTLLLLAALVLTVALTYIPSVFSASFPIINLAAAFLWVTAFMYSIVLFRKKEN